MSDVTTLLPPNATHTERALDQAIAGTAGMSVPVRDIWRADSCPPPLLPWLVWAYSGDEWDSNWSEAQQRGSVAGSTSLHRRKGSVDAVQQALLALGFVVRVQEWHRQTPMGLPFTFRLLLEVDQVGIDAAGMQQILRTVDTTKNLRSHLTEIQLNVRTRTALHLSTVAALGHHITVPVPPGSIFLNEHVLIVA